jgi:hypothetical protein
VVRHDQRSVKLEHNLDRIRRQSWALFASSHRKLRMLIVLADDHKEHLRVLAELGVDGSALSFCRV